MTNKPEAKGDWILASIDTMFQLDSGASPGNFRAGDFSGPTLVYGANGPIGSSYCSNYGPGYLIGRVGAAGAITRVSERVWASDNTLTATPKTNKCNERFAEHFLRFINPSKLATTTAQPLITQGNLSRLSSLTPRDIAEQTRIAYVLDTIDEAIAKTEAMIAKLKQVRAGMLHDLLRYGLDENGQLRDPAAHPEQFQDSPVGRIPREWDAFELQQLFALQTGATPSRQQEKRFFSDGSIPWVKTLDLNENWIERTEERITKEALIETSCRLLPIKTILIAMYGGWEQIGRTGILGIPAATNQALCALISKSEVNDPEFVFRSLQFGRIRWRKFAASTRKDPNISKGDVGRFFVPIPSNRHEQDEICRLLALSDKQINSGRDELNKLRQLFAGLQDDLLTGRVRVPETIREGAAGV